MKRLNAPCYDVKTSRQQSCAPMRNQVNVYPRLDMQAVEKSLIRYRQSVEILNQSKPDTFLGRRTFEPFPKEQHSGG